MNTYRGNRSAAGLFRLYAIGRSLHLSVELFIQMILPIDQASYVSLHPSPRYDGKGVRSLYPIARSTRKIPTNEKVFCAYFNGSFYDGLTGKLCGWQCWDSSSNGIWATWIRWLQKQWMWIIQHFEYTRNHLIPRWFLFLFFLAIFKVWGGTSNFQISYRSYLFFFMVQRY